MIAALKKECFIIIMMLVVPFLLFSCGETDFCLTKELSRTPSPNGRVDAVAAEKNCGATTSKALKIHVVESGEEIDSEQFVFLSDKTKGLTVDWIDNHTLMLSYLEARIFQFRNFWNSEKLDNSRYEVKIIEIQIDH